MARNIKIALPNYGKQEVGFINILGVFAKNAGRATPIAYNTDGDKRQNIIALLNYVEATDPFVIHDKQGLGFLNISTTEQGIDVFKQEIDKDGNALTSLELVAKNLRSYKFRDYNVSNHRNYRYFIYLSPTEQSPTEQSPTEQSPTEQKDKKIIYKTSFDIYTDWQQWSITELHPTDESMKTFTANPEDVWLFNLNIDSGAQAQNVSFNEVQTLGVYPRISQGKGNYVSGSVSCLLGSDVISVGEALKRVLSLSDAGYLEMRKYSSSITSNQRVDMLKAWRKLVASKNPKLLKDREGQSFLVSLSNSTNKPMDAARLQPNTINFNWTQIGTLDGVTIVGTFDDNLSI